MYSIIGGNACRHFYAGLSKQSPLPGTVMEHFFLPWSLHTYQILVVTVLVTVVLRGATFYAFIHKKRWKRKDAIFRRLVNLQWMNASEILFDTSINQRLLATANLNQCICKEIDVTSTLYQLFQLRTH